MIACKIVTNYNDEQGKFSQLMEGLAELGDVIWNGSYIFFGDTTHINTGVKEVEKLLKKSGFKNFFIDAYSKENQPNESEDINGWLADKLIKINYALYEKESQEVFKNISIGLDMLDKEIDQIGEKYRANKEREAKKNGGRKNKK